jgi:hypothetical protein
MAKPQAVDRVGAGGLGGGWAEATTGAAKTATIASERRRTTRDSSEDHPIAHDRARAHRRLTATGGRPDDDGQAQAGGEVLGARR